MDCLIKEIRSAFSKRKKPSDCDLISGHVFEDSEGERIANKLHGKTWEELSIDDIIWHNASLHFLSPVGVAYYLPAFLIPAVTDFTAIDVTIYSLASYMGYEKGDSKRFDAFWEILDSSERLCVVKSIVVLSIALHDDQLELSEILNARLTKLIKS